MKHISIIALALGVAACATTPPPKPRPIPTVSVPMRATGLERVLGQDVRALSALFGPPDQDVKEAAARRLQFAGPFCILDTYLYPSRTGAEPIVTYMDARQPDGKDIDRASCVAALVRRKEAR